MTEYIVPGKHIGEPGTYVCVRFAGLRNIAYDNLELALNGDVYCSVERESPGSGYSKYYSFPVVRDDLIYVVYGKVTIDGVVYETSCKMTAKSYTEDASLMDDEDLPIADSFGAATAPAVYVVPDDPEDPGGGDIPPSPEPSGEVTFIPDDLTPPSLGTIQPGLCPTVHDQYDIQAGIRQNQYGSCVAETVVAAMELFHMRSAAHLDFYETYSVPFVFGAPDTIPDTSTQSGDNDDWMYFAGAVYTATRIGAPRWEFSNEYKTQRMSKSEARALYSTRIANENIANHAKKQCFSGYEETSPYDFVSVYDAISTYGCFMISICIPHNFPLERGSDWGTDYVIPQPSGGWEDYSSSSNTGAGHAMLLIGSAIKTVNGINTYCWIAQNSWGEDWGENGRCYIPYNWGKGVDSPQGRTSWYQRECYTLIDTDIPTNHPSPPVIKKVTQDTTDKKKYTIEFQKASQNDSDYVFLYAQRTDDDVKKWWPKSNTTDAAVPYGVFSTSPATITVDRDDGKYLFSALTMGSYMVSARSEVKAHGAGMPWSWEHANYPDGANDAKTIRFYQVLHGNADPAGGFSCLVWNDIVRKAAEVVSASGHTWNKHSGLGIEGCKVINGEAFSAKKYNEVRFNIGSIKSTDEHETDQTKPSTVVKAGDNIYGYHFDRLTVVMNKIIRGED